MKGSTTKRGETLVGDGVVQVDPSRGRTDTRVHQRERWPDQALLELRGYLDGLASLAFTPWPSVLHEAL